MKKFLVITLLIFAGIFIASCVEDEDLDDFIDTDSYGQGGGYGGSDNNSGYDSNSSEDEIDEDLPDMIETDETNTDSGDSASSDTNDSGDSDDSGDSTPADPADSDSGDSTPADPADSDSGDSTPADPADSDSGDTNTPDPSDSDSGDTNTPDPSDSDSGDTNTPDPSDSDSGDTDPDDPQGCTEITLNTTLTHNTGSYYDNYYGYDCDYEYLTTSYTPNTGSSSTDTFRIEIYDMSDPSGTYDLEGQKYSSQYGVFLLVFEDGGSKKYFPREGDLNVTYDYDHGLFSDINYDSITAKLTGVILEETTIDSSSFQTTPVTNGTCLKIKDTTLNYYEESDGW